MYRGWLTTLIILCAAWSVPSHAQTAAPVNRTATALSNTRTQVYYGVLLNPDCSLAGSYAVKIRKQPKAGRLEIDEEGGFPSYPAGNPRAQCNNRQVPMTKIFYTSDPDYAGTDSFELEMFDPVQAKSAKVSVSVQVKR